MICVTTPVHNVAKVDKIGHRFTLYGGHSRGWVAAKKCLSSYVLRGLLVTCLGTD